MGFFFQLGPVHSIHKSSAIHFYCCTGTCNIFLPAFGMLTCVQLLMHVIAHGGCVSSVSVHRKLTLGEKSSVTYGIESTSVLFNPTLYQLSCPIHTVDVWLLLYSTILHSWADWLCLPVILNEWLFFNSVFLNMHWSGVLPVLFCCYMAGATWNCWYSVCSVYTVQPCAMWCHFMQSHIRRVHTCLAVTRTVGRMTGIFCDATAVTWGWNEDRNKSQHRSWPWRQKNKKIPPLLLGLKPKTFQSQVWCCIHWAIPKGVNGAVLTL